MRMSLGDFLGGGAVATPKRMKLTDFLSGGPTPVEQPPQQPSVPFVNQPTFEPLDDVQLGPANNPLNPDRIGWGPETANLQRAIPDIAGPLEDYNLSEYVDPELKNPPSMELPKSMLTPPEVRASTLSDIRERNADAALEFGIAAENQRQAEEAFHTPEPEDRDQQYARTLHRSRYYWELPYSMNKEVLDDPELFDRYRELNELATGAPLLDTPPDRREAVQLYIDSQRKLMQASGVEDPALWVAQREANDGPQNFVTRNLAAAGNAALDSLANINDFRMEQAGFSGNPDEAQRRGIRAAWREAVEDVKDERSPLPNVLSETARGVSRAAPQLAAAAGVGFATKNPALAWATMLGPTGVETFQVGRSNGLSKAEAAAYAAATVAIEYATAKVGGAIANKLGTKTFEELAFGTGKHAAGKGLKPLLGAFGGSVIEGGEEVAASVGQEFSEYVAGLDEEFVDESTPETLALSFAVGMVASGAMHSLQKFSDFVDNPTLENAKAAGITEELAPTQVDRESLAAAASQQMSEMAARAPESPVDASVKNATQTPDLPVDVQEDVATEPALPPEAVGGVRADTGEADSAANLQRIEAEQPVPQPRRRLGERIPAPIESTPPPVAPPEAVTPSAPVDEGVAKPRRLGQPTVPQPAEALPDWVTEQTAPEAPAINRKQRNDLSRIRRRLKQKLDPQTYGELSSLSEFDQHAVVGEADRRADVQGEFLRQVLDDLSRMQMKGRDISLITRNKERAGRDASRIPGFDELTEQLRNGSLPSLAAYAESRGNGDVESGLFDILQGGKNAIEAELVGPETHVFDVLEEYRERLERSPEETSGGFGDEVPQGRPADEQGGGVSVDGNAPEAGDFTLSGEGARDTSPIVEPYKVPDKDRVAPKTPTQRQPRLDGLPEDMDESVLEGQRGLFSANTGEQLQPSAPKVIVTPPKSQRQIIAELSKALDIPIRFGRQQNRQAGGIFFKKQNIITSKKANDLPVVTHEVGHKLDAMFELSRDPKIAAELNRLGDPATPGSRSSWTKSKSKGYKLGEGIAEFIRYWMTDPVKAKKEAPLAYEKFEATLDANKDLGDSLRQAQEDIKLWRTAQPQARLRSQISIGENPNKTRYTLSQLTRDVVDDLHFLRLASEDAKLGQPDLKPSQNPYLLARNLRGSYGMASTFIQNGAVDFKSKDVDLGTSLEDALKPVGGRINDFRDWIVAKRAQELHRRAKDTGLVKSDVDAVAAKFDGDADFEKAFEAVKQWNDRVLQYAVDSGLVTEGSAATIREMNKDYVPFHRLFEVGANEPPSSEGGGSGSGLNAGKPGSLKKLKGSTRNIVDPLETMVHNAYAIITASEKAAISTAVADLANLPDMGRWVEKVSRPLQPKEVRVDEIIDQLEELGADVTALEKSADVLTFFRLANKPPKGENTIGIIRDGTPEFYRLNRDLYSTFEALDLDDAGKLVRILSTPAQVLRAGVTLEPGFNIANLLRDTVGAAVINKYGALPFETTLRGIGALINNPQLVAEWAASGGRSSVEANYFDRKKMQKYLAERISKDLTAAERALIVAKSPLAALRWMASTFEEATRIGEYQINYNAMKKAGMADGEARRLAAFEARDRQDFAKGGAKTKILRHAAAFWNAQVQANVRLAQAFKERPFQTTLKGIAFVTLPKLLEQAINWDDEDYWERPQWERDAFFMIPIGKDDAGHTRFLRVPVPFEIGIIFGTVPGRFLQWAKQNNPDAVKDLPAYFAKQTVPIPNPSGALTVMELLPDQGYSYFRGREIVPDSMADMPKDMQWTQQTSTLAKKVGQTLGISPMKVDYFIESTTGGSGKVALGKQVPGERFVSKDLAVTGQPISDFYDIRDKLTEDAERLKATGESEGMGPVMLAEFEKVGEQVGNLRNKAREETDPIKKAAIEDEAYQLTRQMVQKYRDNPEPEEAVKEYATKAANKAVLSHGFPKKKLGEKPDDYSKRKGEWEEQRDRSLKWLRSHKDSPAVQAAIAEVAKKIPSPPMLSGRIDPKFGQKRREWVERYGSAAELVKSLQ